MSLASLSARVCVAVPSRASHSRSVAPAAHLLAPQQLRSARSHAPLRLRSTAASRTAAGNRGASLTCVAASEPEDILGSIKFPFYKVETIIRPWRLPYVTAALEKKGFRGLTAYEVKGIGFQANANVERNQGTEFGKDTLVDKVKIEIVVVRKQVQEVIDIILDSSHTGEVGDGKIFVSPIMEVVRIRTGESGLAAERMDGGAEDMNSDDSASALLSSRF